MSGRSPFLKERLQAALLLVVYLCACTPLAALSAAGIAWFDGEHRVRLSMGAEGMRVLLQHDQEQIRVPSSHTHCLVSNALVLLAQSPNESDPDHVLSFHSVKAGGLPSLNERMVPALPQGVMLAYAAKNSPLFPSAVAQWPQLLSLPPPDTSVHVVRSTVFLI